MAFNTKSIVKDVNQKPAPQYYNPAADVYEVLQGANGANRVTLYTAAGAAIDLQSLITSIITAINTTATTQDRRDLRGLAANKPAANAVLLGATYWSIDTGAIEVSNGTSWVVV